jgi:hypothetical protein
MKKENGINEKLMTEIKKLKEPINIIPLFNAPIHPVTGFSMIVDPLLQIIHCN